MPAIASIDRASALIGRGESVEPTVIDGGVDEVGASDSRTAVILQLDMSARENRRGGGVSHIFDPTSPSVGCLLLRRWFLFRAFVASAHTRETTLEGRYEGDHVTCDRCGKPVEGRKGPRGQGRPRRYCDDHYGRSACVKQRCTRTANRPGGLCSYHAKREVTTQKAWKLRDELIDFLELEGWATAAEMSARFDRHIDSVERTLRKLRSEGLVTSKVVVLAYSSQSTYETRTEWHLDHTSSPDDFPSL
jgi:hypothetical protein